MELDTSWVWAYGGSRSSSVLLRGARSDTSFQSNVCMTGTSRVWSMRVRSVPFSGSSLHQQGAARLPGHYGSAQTGTPAASMKTVREMKLFKYKQHCINPRTCRGGSNGPPRFFANNSRKTRRIAAKLDAPLLDQFDTYCENFKSMSCQVIKL